MGNFPKLDSLFFAVCSTAIKNTSWKYADFEKVKLVEGQLLALKNYVESLPADDQPKEEPKQEEGVAIEMPNQEKKNS